jgi:hypothetical protein
MCVVCISGASIGGIAVLAKMTYDIISLHVRNQRSATTGRVNKIDCEEVFDASDS